MNEIDAASNSGSASLSGGPTSGRGPPDVEEIDDLNVDEPKPIHEGEEVKPTKDLSRVIQKTVEEKKRTSKEVPSRRVESSSRDVKAYKLRQKFLRLNKEDPRITVPDCRDPDKLQEMYEDAYFTYAKSNSSGTWITLIGTGCAVFELIMNRFLGIDAKGYTQCMSAIIPYYHYIFKDMGDVGFVSIMSDWSPEMKLVAVLIIHTGTFFVMKKLTDGEVDKIRSTMKGLVNTGIAGGDPTGEKETSQGGGGGGMMDMVNNLIGSFMGGGGEKKSPTMDLDNPPPPDDDDDEEVNPFEE